jgi:ketosteroid isomerase-like protein
MDDTAAIEALQNRWMQAWLDRDRVVIEAILAPGFHLRSITSDGLVDRATWIDDAIGGRVRGTAFEYSQMRVTVDGDTAVADSLLRFEGSIDGKDWSTTAWCTDVWSRRSGGWQAVKRHASAMVGRAGAMRA